MVRIPVTAVTFSWAAIYFSAVYNIQCHQRPAPIILYLYDVGGYGSVEYVKCRFGLSPSSHTSYDCHDITDIFLLWRKTKTNKQTVPACWRLVAEPVAGGWCVSDRWWSHPSPSPSGPCPDCAPGGQPQTAESEHHTECNGRLKNHLWTISVTLRVITKDIQEIKLYPSTGHLYCYNFA